MRTGEPLPAVGDALASSRPARWHWDTATGLVTVDAEAARLLGLPAEQTTLTEAQVRARPVDWNEITGVVRLAAAEGTLAEVRVRIMDERGRMIRVVRSRSKPSFDARKKAYELIGTLQEVTEPTPGRPGAPPSPATGGAPGRRSCWTRAARWPRRGPPRRSCGSRPACRCQGSRRTGWPSSAWRATG